MALALLDNRPTAAKDPEPLSDMSLAARVACGDERSFERIMRANNRLLYRTARSILHDDEEAEDVLQEAYLKAFYGMGNYKGQAKLSTWLVRIVINEALERRRKLAHGPTYIANGDSIDWETLSETAQSQSPPRPGPEAMAMREELSRLIQRHVERLPTVFRIVFVLRALEEMTVEETARCLEIPEATVRTRYLRARRLLQEHAARDIEAALDASFAFAGARCDRMVLRVLTRIRNLSPLSG